MPYLIRACAPLMTFAEWLSASACFRVADQHGRERFQRDHSTERAIVGFKDDPHAAMRDLAPHLVVAEQPEASFRGLKDCARQNVPTIRCHWYRAGEAGRCGCFAARAFRLSRDNPTLDEAS